MASKLDPGYLEAVAKVRERLSTLVTPKLLSDLYGQKTRASLNVDALNELGCIVRELAPSVEPWTASGNYGSITNTPIDLAAEPPTFCSTQALLALTQDIIAENLKNSEGLRRGEYTGLSLQTVFLLDLQRYLARRLPSRLQRVVRAAHRRASLAGERGPIDLLQNTIEREMNVK